MGDREPRPSALDEVLITGELRRRPPRPADPEAEADALAELAAALADDPAVVLPAAARQALRLTAADSAGVSLPEPGGGALRWRAVAGALAPLDGRAVDPAASPCGVTLARDGAQLFARPDRAFPAAAAVDPPLVEMLTVPFRVAGAPGGVVWAAVHDPARRFAEADARTLTRLARFAAAAAAAARPGVTAETRAEDRFRALVTATSDVVYRMSPDWSEMLHLYGRGFLADTGAPSASWVDAYILPEDQPHVLRTIDEAVRARGVFELEHRVRRADGSVGWTHSRAVPLLGPGGEVVEWFGAASDVTARKRAEEALRHGEERLRLVLASATEHAIFTMDPDRRITGWSAGATAVFGYTEGEALGRAGDMIFTPEDRAAGAPEAESQAALRDGRAADERWHLRKDGSRFYASGVLTPMSQGVGPRGFVKVATDLTARKRAEDDLRAARDELEARVAERTAELARANGALRDGIAARTELLRRVVTAQEDERRRVARDLHDGLGQELTALILGLKALEQDVPEGAPGRDRLRAVEAGVARIGREAHDLAVDLRPTALDDLGLAPALEEYVSRWSERTGVAAGFQAVGLEGRLPPDVETAVYRVVQEALNNAARHAGARRVSVIVERSPSALTALVEDDGRGFDPAGVDADPRQRRLGLIGMRERVALVGGTLLVESGVGEGTTVRARVPLGPGGGGDSGDRH